MRNWNLSIESFTLIYKDINLTEEYWDQRYKGKSIPWDLGEVSPPIKTYVDKLKDKQIKILIPGAGHAYEAEYLFKNGFTNVYIVDISKTALNNFEKRQPTFPKQQLIHSDFFELSGSFDMMIEQTFFCALELRLRKRYVEHVSLILKTKARLVGLLFDFPLTDVGPPFGGTTNEYRELFSEKFKITILERCYNSHPSRVGKELFIEMSQSL